MRVEYFTISYIYVTINYVYQQRKVVNIVENALQTSFLDDSLCEQTTGVTYIKRKKRKQLEINVDGALVELNLLLLPLAPVGREKDDVGTIIVKWTDSKGALRGIKVSMTDGYKMLTNFDIKVLTSLMKLYSEQNTIIPYDFENNKYDMPVEINYTIREISRRLRYSECGGTITKKIKDSIKKLANVTITSMYEGGLYDAEHKCYIKTTGEKGFHIIEEYDMYEVSKVENKEDRIKARDVKSFNKVVINNFFYNSMCNGYCKIVPFDQLIGIKQDIAQRLFALLEGWFCNKKPFVYFNFTTLYSRIPLDNDTPIKEKNRSVKRACEELKKIGYIENFVVKPSKGVYFIFEGGIDYDNPDNMKDKYFGLDKYGGIKDVISALLEYGIEENEIDMYVKESNIEYHKALLRYFNIMLRYDKIKGDNPLGFLLEGLKGDYNIDPKYYNK